MKWFAFVWLVLVACALTAIEPCLAAGEVEIIPRSVLFGNPEKALPDISPDGTMLAYVAPVDGVINVWIKTIGKDDDRAVTKDTDRGIYSYFWGGDSKHLLYLQDKGGNENWQLFDVVLATGEIRSLTPFDSVAVEVVGRDKHFPDHLILGINKEDKRFHDAYHLDLKTGELKMVAKNPGNIAGWVADNYLQVRLAAAPTPEGGMDLLYRGDNQDSWKKILTWDADNSMTRAPIGFAKPFHWSR